MLPQLFLGNKYQIILIVGSACLLDLQQDSPVVCIDCRAADRLYAHAVQKRARQQAARQAQEQDTSNSRSPSPRSHAFKRHAPDFFQRQQVLTLLADTTQFPQFSILCMSECSITSLHTSSKPYASRSMPGNISGRVCSPSMS